MPRDFRLTRSDFIEGKRGIRKSIEASVNPIGNTGNDAYTVDGVF